MDEKKRTLLAVVISCIILLAVGYSFGLNFFRSTPEIVVADTRTSPGVSAGPDASGNGDGIPVEVTRETVRNIIAGMERYRSYSRTLSIRYYWENGSGAVTVQVMADGGWTRCDAVLASGLVEHSILGDGHLWYWYDDKTDYLRVPAEEGQTDLLQYIPTYETVLALDDSGILDAGYEEKNGEACIYVEARGQLEQYVERYWVSVTSGLLWAAETEKNGALVYSMSSGGVVSPLTGETAFLLPDGGVLHTPQG